MSRRILPVLCLLALPALLGAQDYGVHLVSVRVTTQSYDHYTPWRKRNPAQSELQGTVIAGGRILTVAPPLADSVLVEVSKHGSQRRYPAEVILKDHVAGLALLSVSDEGFFADLSPVSLADPGAPSGPLKAARWESGGVLRVFTASLVKTAVDYPPPTGVTLAHYLATEMDRGGFGEAIFSDGKLVGMAYQLEASSRSLKTHAVEVIRRLIDDTEDGTYAGYPSSWEYERGLDGDRALKRYLGMDPDETGLMITAVPPRMTGAGVLEQGDVILTVDGHPIDDAGMYRSAAYGQLRYEPLLFLEHAPGDTVVVRVLRKGERQDLDVPLLPIEASSFLIPLLPDDAPPPYLVFGGLVFQELTRSYLQGAWGGDWRRSADSRLLYLYQNLSLFPAEGRRRVVIMNRVLPHAVNAGYQSQANLVLESLGGQPVSDLEHLSRLIETRDETYAVFGFSGSDRIVLSYDRARAADREIRSLYGLPAVESDRADAL